jgi:DNA-binding NtrC family response regulator
MVSPVGGSDPQRELQLLVLEAKGLTTQTLPRTGTLSIGRAESCSVKLSDPLASRHHATLRMEPLTLIDEGSANGTFLAGNPLPSASPTALEPHQVFTIGNTLLVLRPRISVTATEHSPASGPNGDRLPRVIEQPEMRTLYEVVARLAQGAINVLIVGETGVGKELVAEAIHRHSPRAKGPLVRINSAAFAEPLLESELFGHERGAFTGAVSTKLGLLESAHGGTVFLDEVGELPLRLQAKLLRVIEAREVTRVGGLQARRIDVRFVAATNRRIEQEVEAGAFRSDLLFRLQGALLEVPPLRERPLEIEPLALAFAREAAAQMNLSQPPRFSTDAIAALQAYPWPGNVRELRNAVERAVLLSSGGELTPADLELGRAARETARLQGPESAVNTLAPAPPLGPASPLPAEGDSERARILHALVTCAGNQRRAAEMLGLSRRTLVRRIAELDLPRPRASQR